MRLIGRIGYYLAGFIIGLLLLFFFLGGKKASCDYGPNARVLKQLRAKERIIDPGVLIALRQAGLDSTAIDRVLLRGDVLFDESQPRKEPCPIYLIKSTDLEPLIKVGFENCTSRVKINTLVVLTD